MSAARHGISLAHFMLGMFVFFGLLDGASTARFIWEPAMFGAFAGALIYAGLLVGFGRDRELQRNTQTH